MNIMTLFRKIGNAFASLKNKKHQFDLQMKNHYAPKRLAILCCFVVALLAIIMLFIPPYLGLSNDGTFDAVLADTHLARLSEEDLTPSVNFYETTYAIQTQAYMPNTTPLPLRFMVTLATELDTLFTRDFLFDIRVLALLYLLLYVPLIYPIILFTLKRVRYYSEGLAISFLCVLVFGDVSIVSRFASLYTQPLEYIGMLSLAGSLFYLRHPKQQVIRLLQMVLSALLLVSVNAYCAVAIMVISALCWYCMPTQKNILWRFGCIVLALVLCIFAVISVYDIQNNVTPIQKYNAMTRGVMLQAKDPVKALASFGIEPRFSVLTGTYGDQNFPVVLPEGGLVDEGFLNEYETSDIALYALSHPMELLSMFDIGIHSAFHTRPDYAGNYEESISKEVLSKSPFMPLWSQFKSDAAPKTYYVFGAMVFGIVFLFAYGQKSERAQKEGLHLSVMLISLMLFTVIELITVFIISGDSELMRQSYLMSCFIDLLALLFVGEIVHRLDIIRGEDEK